MPSDKPKPWTPELEAREGAGRFETISAQLDYLISCATGPDPLTEALLPLIKQMAEREPAREDNYNWEESAKFWKNRTVAEKAAREKAEAALADAKKDLFDARNAIIREGLERDALRERIEGLSDEGLRKIIFRVWDDTREDFHNRCGDKVQGAFTALDIFCSRLREKVKALLSGVPPKPEEAKSEEADELAQLKLDYAEMKAECHRQADEKETAWERADENKRRTLAAEGTVERIKEAQRWYSSRKISADKFGVEVCRILDAAPPAAPKEATR